MPSSTSRLIGALWPLLFAATTVSAQGAPPADTGRPRYTRADVQFMQGMIDHHGQALAMTALVPGRSTRPDIALLAQRIEVSQRDEIKQMKRWLEDRHESAANAEMAMAGHDMTHGTLMPGMLTAQQMAALEKARGTAFDWLFLAGMIRHHEGALLMVKQLFATPGAAQEPQLFGFASEVDTDQRAEIARMRRLPGAPHPSTTPRPR